MKIPAKNEEEKTKENATLKQLNKIAYNYLVLAQDDTVCFHIFEESFKNHPMDALCVHGEIKQENSNNARSIQDKNTQEIFKM